MHRSYALCLAALFSIVAVYASWHLMHRDERPVAEHQSAIDHHDEESVAAPAVDSAAPDVEVDLLADCFPDLLRAQTFSPRPTYGPVDNKTDSLLQIASVPLVSYSSLPTASSTARVNLPIVGELLLFVERGKDETLRDARVLSFLHRRSRTQTSAHVVAVPWQEEGYIVLVDTVPGGLKFRICVIDRQLASAEVLENLLGKSSTEWPNMLRTIGETQEPVPFPANESRMVTVTAEESKAGRHLVIDVRDGFNLKCRQEPDARRCYTFETEEWSSDISQIPEPPWKLEPEGTEVVAVLPMTRPVHVSGQPSVEQPRCLAVVRQQYRSRRPWQDYSLSKTRDAFWVVECGPDCDLNGAVGVGLIHPPPNFPGAEYSCFHAAEARLIFQPELGRYFLVLAGNSVRFYQLDLNQPMFGAPLTLAENSKDWPTPLPVFDEVRLPYSRGGGGSYHHLDGLHSMCGFPLRDFADVGIVVATARLLNSDEPIEFRHGFNFKTRAATTDTLCFTELKITSDRDSVPADDSNRSQSAAPGDPQTCELVAGSTKVLKVIHSFRTQKVGKDHYQKRCVVAVEQMYRFLPTVPDATESLGRAIWILDCTSDCNLKTAVPIGLIHPQQDRTRLSEQIDLTEQPGLPGCLVVLAGAENSNLRIQLFQTEAYKRLNCEALTLPSDPQKWPPQMTRATELKTTVRDLQHVDFLSMFAKTQGFGDSGRATIRIADRNANDATYRWDIENDSWTKVLFSPETSSKYRPQ